MNVITRHPPHPATPRAIGGAVALMLSLAACGGDDRASTAGGDLADDFPAPAGAPVAGGPVVTAASVTDTPPPRQDAAQRSGTMSADQAEDVVEDALRADATLGPFRLDADDERERVVLEGVVATAAQKTRAAEVAARVAPGVPIDNRLRVDADVARRRAADVAADEADDRIEDAFEADPALREFDLDADDEDGRVILEGTVRTDAQRQRAEEVARRVAPDVPLENRIRVR